MCLANSEKLFYSPKKTYKFNNKTYAENPKNVQIFEKSQIPTDSDAEKRLLIT